MHLTTICPLACLPCRGRELPGGPGHHRLVRLHQGADRQRPARRPLWPAGRRGGRVVPLPAGRWVLEVVVALMPPGAGTWSWFLAPALEPRQCCT
jgi:hypothetical protein